MDNLKRLVRTGYFQGQRQSRSAGKNTADPNRHNIGVTGLGRSGTTLVCHLLNKLPNTVALDEPIGPGRFAEYRSDHEVVCDGIERFYRKMRRMALEEGMVFSKHVGGEVPDNHFADEKQEGGLRRLITERGRIPVSKEIRPGFYLAVKDPGLFTAVLPNLKERFPCYAIVRNPLSVMASSRSGQWAKKTRDKPPAAVRYDEELVRHLSRTGDPLEKQLLRLDYFFERFRRELPASHILRYEDIVGSGGRALKVIVPAARELDEPLQSRNANSLYDRDFVLRCGERLLKSEGAYWDFYSRKSVESLMEDIDRTDETTDETGA